MLAISDRGRLWRTMGRLFRDNHSELSDLVLAGFVSMHEIDARGSRGDLSAEEAQALRQQAGGGRHYQRCLDAAAWLVSNGQDLWGPHYYHYKTSGHDKWRERLLPPHTGSSRCQCGFECDLGNECTKVECGKTLSAKVVHVLRSDPWKEVAIFSYEGGDWSFRGPAFVPAAPRHRTAAERASARDESRRRAIIGAGPFEALLGGHVSSEEWVRLRAFLAEEIKLAREALRCRNCGCACKAFEQARNEGLP